MTFPDGFWWGTAASATQAEGAAPASDWRLFEDSGRVPRSGDGNGFSTRYAEDFARYAAHGLTHHRLSIEWARIEPEAGRHDEGAVEHYRQVLAAAHEAGVSPWVCLHHFTVPGWFADEHGFTDDHARSYYWPRHVAFVAETFGDLVAGWKPVNEPSIYAATYLSGGASPTAQEPDRMWERLGAILLAQRDAWRELRGGGAPVATVHALSPIFPVDDSPEARAHADTLEDLLWRTWMLADRDGVLELPGRGAREVPDLREAADLVGFSYYAARGVRGDGAEVPYPPGVRVGPLGYAPWSEGMGLVLRRLHDELPGRPLLVCEHGVGTPADAEDEWRTEVLRDSLAVVEEAIGDGIDVRGFFHWTGVDNYEWTHGFDVSFGCFGRDREPRGSAHLLAEVARALTVPSA